MTPDRVARVLNRVQRPEHTGENRCLPCTAVNLTFAVVIAAAVGIVSITAAALVFPACLAVIYLRGYLVPGTPSLTQRYLPDRVRAWFGKPPTASGTVVGETEDDVPVGEVLDAADAVTECEDVDDVCLTDSFRAAWFERIEGRGPDPASFARAVGIAPEDVVVEESGNVFVSVNDVRRDQWGTRSALVADGAAAAVLRERYPAWDTLPLSTRHGVLEGLRVFLEACPLCDGPLGFEQQQVESGCCGGSQVVGVVRCEDCGAQLVELGEEAVR